MNITLRTISSFLISTSQDDGDPANVCKILDEWLLDWARVGCKTDVDLIANHLEELAFKMRTAKVEVTP
jgi:hypothetical protein